MTSRAGSANGEAQSWRSSVVTVSAVVDYRVSHGSIGFLDVRSPRHLARPLVSTTPGKLPGIHTAGVNKVELRVPIDPSEQFQAILVPGGLAFE
jgi:hypothetical protein